ncbi:TPA: hypothetical protein MMJ71_004779 [Salmonella enterica subsp. enterica serovar Typhimurium]|nr:hypothetical protein [Salmonella enterica subsp. enterica serovar Typhimurium]
MIIGIQFVVGLLVLILLGNFISAIFTDKEEEENPYSYTSIDHNCDDFSSGRDAQLFYEANGGPSSDPHDLDRDDDGQACDWNP